MTVFIDIMTTEWAVTLTLNGWVVAAMQLFIIILLLPLEVTHESFEMNSHILARCQWDSNLHINGILFIFN